MILLTGGTGFLGRYILEGLAERNMKVRLLVRKPENVANLPDYAEVVQGDVLDVLSIEQAMEGVEYVIHSAAVVSFWKKRHAEMREINVVGTANMVNMALEAKVKKFLQISSVAAIGRTEKPVEAITEKTKWVDSKVNAEYGRTKYLAELEVARGVAEGLPAVMVNPGIVIGRGNQNWNSGSPKLFKLIHEGLKFYNPGKTAMVSAEDVTKACLMLMDSHHVQAERFILSAESITFKELFEKIAHAMDVKAPSKCPPFWLSMLIGRLSQFSAGFSGKEPLITPETAHTTSGQFEYDGNKITKELDFSYEGLDKCIQRTAKNYLNEVNGN